MGDVPWMVAIMVIQALVTAGICWLIDRKTTCIDQSKQEDYFTTSISNDGVISYAPVKNNTSNPVNDVKSTLVITLTDAFGHVMVYPMEFLVKRAQ